MPVLLMGIFHGKIIPSPDKGTHGQDFILSGQQPGVGESIQIYKPGRAFALSKMENSRNGRERYGKVF